MDYHPDYRQNTSVGLSFSKDNYLVFEDLDNIAYRVLARYQRFFQSRMSLAGEIALGLKQYPNQSFLQVFDTGGGMNPDQQYSEDPVRSGVLSASVNIAKSLASMTGISLIFGGQWFVGDPVQVYSSGIYYYTENDLFDDPYSYEDIYTALQVTQQFAVGFQAKAGVRFEKKDYKGTPALDEEGELTGETRQDRREEYFFNLSKMFETGWIFPGSVGLFFQYLYRNNPSNDPYYDYKDHIAGIGLTVEL